MLKTRAPMLKGNLSEQLSTKLGKPCYQQHGTQKRCTRQPTNERSIYNAEQLLIVSLAGCERLP